MWKYSAQKRQVKFSFKISIYNKRYQCLPYRWHWIPLKLLCEIRHHTLSPPHQNFLLLANQLGTISIGQCLSITTVGAMPFLSHKLRVNATCIGKEHALHLHDTKSMYIVMIYDITTTFIECKSSICIYRRESLRGRASGKTSKPSLWSWTLDLSIMWLCVTCFIMLPNYEMYIYI